MVVLAPVVGWWFKFLWARAEIGNGLVKGEY